MFYEKQLKICKKVFNKSSIWGKLLILIAIILLVVVIFKNSSKEGFIQKEQFLFKSGADLYDEFYANIYDYLVFNSIKNDYEIGEIVNKTSPTSVSKILDVGCGTGHRVASFAAKNMDVLGIDISPSMIEKAKANYPQYDFMVADATSSHNFMFNHFTHITCMNFTIYYIQDRVRFFQNCMQWLMNGGYFVIHLVNRKNMKNILSPAKMILDEYAYNADFQLDEQNNIAKYTEKITNSENKVRTNEHILYMPETNTIIDEILNAGFILHSQIDLINCQYDNQYLYVFTKPN